jgi:hypothetical protein
LNFKPAGPMVLVSRKGRIGFLASPISFEAWKAVFDKLTADGFIERNKLLGTAAPGLYELVFTLTKK